MHFYIGLMSGTSMDGIDTAIIGIDNDETIQLIATHHHDWPEELRRQLEGLALPGENEIDRMGEADAWAGEVMAAAVNTLLKKTSIPRASIEAIGSHGQTIRHRPRGIYPFTLQIGDPNRISARTCITTIADFRRRDIAHGGQGAPLTPAFHKAVFSSPHEYRVVINIGGIANLTVLPADPDEDVIGFDSGPGNRLLDDWIECSLGKQYDQGGEWAASGRISRELLSLLTSDSYFLEPAPKSTGTEYFNLEWLDQRSAGLIEQLPPEDVQATLLELTAVTVCEAISHHAKQTERLFVCGGGAHNKRLMDRMSQLLPETHVGTTDELGLDPDWVEAAAFAWLAYRTLQGLSGNLVEVTGARQSTILGCIHPVGKINA